MTINQSRLLEEETDPGVLIPIQHNFPGGGENVERYTRVYSTAGRIVGHIARCAGIRKPNEKGRNVTVKPDFWVYCINLQLHNFPGAGVTFGKPTSSKTESLQLLADWLEKNIGS